MSKKYTVDYFIKKFSAIPEDKWILREFIDSEDPTRRCTEGHCSDSYSRYYSRTPEVRALEVLTLKHFNIYPSSINDAVSIPECLFLGSHPKERILNALELIKLGISI